MIDKSTQTACSVSVVDDSSGRSLFASVARLGQDLVVAVGGGDVPHVGVTVMAQPYPARSRPGRVSASCSVLTIPPHKEEGLAREVALGLTEAFNCVTVVSAGVHEHGLDREGVADYLRLTKDLVAAVITSLERAS